MSDDIRIDLYYNNEIYRANGNLFDFNTVDLYMKELQKDYSAFTGRINSEGGFIDLHLSHNGPKNSDIHFDARLMNVSDQLREDIYNQFGY